MTQNTREQSPNLTAANPRMFVPTQGQERSQEMARKKRVEEEDGGTSEASEHSNWTGVVWLVQFRSCFITLPLRRPHQVSRSDPIIGVVFILVLTSRWGWLGGKMRKYL